jgi:GNAT superfamily N-acetyltransferase
MSLANYAFLAKHLLMTEMLAPELEDCTGGVLAWCDGLRAGLWDPSKITNAEEFVKGLLRQAAERRKQLADVVVLLPPEEQHDPRFNELCDALFVYGLPRATGLNHAGPELVQVLDKPLPATGKFTVKPAKLDSPEVSAMFDLAGDSADRPDSPAWRDDDLVMDRSQIFVAWQGETPAGMLAVTTGELAARISLCWVETQFRGHGVGRELIAQAVDYAGGQGVMLLCAWTHREGTLRYYMNKLGFVDQLAAAYFFSEP